MAELPKFQQEQYRFSAHIRNPQKTPGPAGIEDRRLAIYRDLFYNNVEGFLARSFPVIRRLLSDAAWHGMVRDFFARHRSHSPYFLDIPKEFLGYLETERDVDGDPPFLLELAHYEWAELAISILEEDLAAVEANVDGDLLDEIPVLSPVAWSLAYRFPVHQIKPEFQPQEPGEGFTFLVVYRNRKDTVGFLEINPVTARLIELLETNTSASGRQLLLQIGEEINHPNPDTVVAGGAETLTELAAHDIILGTRKH
ncbi:MAG: DUF2063 domain-containing protein [Gammaproteobacteria bacterium]|nr:DUF2063 domain-containing protein [Gammaproteobacteria bacterium]